MTKSKSPDHVIKGSCDFLGISHKPDKFGDNEIDNDIVN